MASTVGANTTSGLSWLSSGRGVGRHPSFSLIPSPQIGLRGPPGSRPLSSSMSRSIVRGYAFRSSFGANCIGFTNSDMTVSGCRFSDVRTSDRWPSCRAPICAVSVLCSGAWREVLGTATQAPGSGRDGVGGLPGSARAARRSTDDYAGHAARREARARARRQPRRPATASPATAGSPVAGADPTGAGGRARQAVLPCRQEICFRRRRAMDRGAERLACLPQIFRCPAAPPPGGPAGSGAAGATAAGLLTVGTRPTSRPRLRASLRQRRSWGTERMMGTWRGAWVVPLEMVECRREQVWRAGRATDIGGDMGETRGMVRWDEARSRWHC